MKPRLKATRAARELIKAYEPFKPEAVLRGRRWVVGYGHTAAAKPGASVTREDAELLLIYDVAQAETAVKTLTGDALPPASRDALISFAASIGVGAFKVSDVARLTRQGRHEDAARAMESWVRAEEDGRLVVSERLQRRRRAEKTLYLEGLAGPSAARSTALDEEPQLGMLVDVDIAFEEPDIAPDADIPDPADLIAAPDPEAPVEEPVAATPETTTPQMEDDQATEPEAPQDSPHRKAEQDAAISAVMARMAGEIAASMGDAQAAPAPQVARGSDSEPNEDDEPATPDYSNARLGFSYLSAAPIESSGNAGAPAASMPTPVYATVTVGPYVPPADMAPPHPASAPASAGGLSGESEGPDHEDADEQHEAGEDIADLDPALVAGPEAPAEFDEAPMPSEGRGDWVYTANLAVGLGLTGYGAWDLISNLDAYLAVGLDFSMIGPVAFGAGVLLSAASGWYVVGAMRRRSKG